jgi:hypothetical protein
MGINAAVISFDGMKLSPQRVKLQTDSGISPITRQEWSF